MATSALLKNTVSIEEWMVAATFIKYRNTENSWKKLLPATKGSSLQGKIMSCHLTKIFVHLPSVIVAVCLL